MRGRWLVALLLAAGCSGERARTSNPPEPGPEDSGIGTQDTGPRVDGGVVPTGPLTRLEGHGIPGVYYGGLAVADFDADGRPDVVLAGAWDKAFAVPDQSLFAYEDRVRIYRNVSEGPGDIHFALAVEFEGVTGGGGALVRRGDFDGDGKPDFAVQFRDGDSPASDTSAFLNRGAFTFDRVAVAEGFDTQNNSLGMDAADIDGDGRDDLAFINTGYGTGPGLWYRYEGGAFRAMQADFPHEISYGGTLTLGDLTGDGLPEVAVGGNGSQPFGNYDCSSALLYGQVHRNLGAGAGFERGAHAVVTDYALSVDRANPPRCGGMDNAGMLIADVDGDGHGDIVLAGSATAFEGPEGSDWTHYDLAVLYNRDGTGQNFVTWENAGPGFPGGVGATNGGAGNIDFPNIAVGDLTGDGLPELLIQGHHKDYSDGVGGSYRFDTRIYENRGDHFVDLQLDLPQLAECGGSIVDLDGDGANDVIYCGASRAFHTNGANGSDFNDASTIHTVILRRE